MKIVPAILTNDAADLEVKIRQAEKFAPLAQIDVMDGMFVPSNSVSFKELQPIKTDMELEIHLMVKNPIEYFDGYKKANAKRILFHLEAVDNASELLDEIKKLNMETGLALNPETPIDKVLPYLEKLDMILLLAVNPGFYGSPFIPSVLDKARELSGILTNRPNIVLSLDGGVKADNIIDIYNSGVQQAVAGSSIFKGDPEANYKNLIKKF